jgi:hypothetical protein
MTTRTPKIRKTTDASNAVTDVTRETSRLDTSRQQRNQDLFLEAFGTLGTVTYAAKQAGVHRSLHYLWLEANARDYRDRFEQAKRDFGDFLEQLALSRVTDPQGNRGSDMLVVALLNANLPGKYRPNVTVVDNTAKDLLKRLGLTGQKRIGKEDAP